MLYGSGRRSVPNEDREDRWEAPKSEIAVSGTGTPELDTLVPETAITHSPLLATIISQRPRLAAVGAKYDGPSRGGSSAGQSRGLIIPRSRVRVPPAPQGKLQIDSVAWG